MLTYLRYALATFCFAASVGCLALWCHTIVNERRLSVACVSTLSNLQLHVADGTGSVQQSRGYLGTSLVGDWQFKSSLFRGRATQLAWTGDQQGAFGRTRTCVFFPIWYASLIFALAGIAALRLGRRFTLRSAMIATTVVAGLLGMAVGL